MFQGKVIGHGGNQMGKTKIEKEITEIIGLPIDEFTFYEQSNTQNYSLFIHHKHFDDWINMYNKEFVLSEIGRYIIDKHAINKFEIQNQNKYIRVFLKGKEKAIFLYKYEYLIDKLIQVTTENKKSGETNPIISYCDWNWFK